MPKDALAYSLRVRLSRSEVFFGPGVAELICRVDRTGSLQNAAAEMEMSYSKAWKVVRKAEQELGFQLLERRTGGSGGGGSCLTDQGRNFVMRYETFEYALRIAADQLFGQYFGDALSLCENNEETVGATNEKN